MSEDFLCPRCFMNFESNLELIQHLTRENICNLKNPAELGHHETQSNRLMTSPDTKHFSGELLRKIVNSQAESREFAGENPVNAREIPCKFTKKPCKYTTFQQPANVRKTSKLSMLDEGDIDINNNNILDEIYDDKLNERKKFICDLCGSQFSTKHNMNRHKGRKHDIDIETNICKPVLKLKIPILIENQTESLELQEIRKLHNRLSKLAEVEEKLAKLDEVDERLTKLEIAPPTMIENKYNQNNSLNVLCVGDQNYLDILTEQLGFDRALEFIQNCALSNLTGDCKLLERIYFEGVENDPPIRYLDKNKTKLEFLNEKQEKVIDIKGVQLIRKLVSNLQNSYLKGVNFLINRNLASKKCPNKFLGEYDIQTWNNHIYTLCDLKYQKKLLSQIDIPCIKIH